MIGGYAKNQPSGFHNYIKDVAIVGASGRSGSFMVDALNRTGKHRVTAITRGTGSGDLPAGVHSVKKIDYDNKSSIVEALKGQDILIITMNVMAPPDSQTRLIDAAVEAGVKWIVPNEWGGDFENERLAADTGFLKLHRRVRDHIDQVGGKETKYFGVACGFWYEFSLAGTESRYGFDFGKKEVTFYDDGKVKISTSTFPRLGQAVASLLSLKVLPDDENDTSPHLNQYDRGIVRVESFCVSQREMFDSVLRVTGDDEKSWKISHENVEERFKRGQKMFEDGQMLGWVILLYARVFFKDGGGDFTSKVDNRVLGLPKEDLDEATKEAVRMAKAGDTNAVTN